MKITNYTYIVNQPIFFWVGALTFEINDAQTPLLKPNSEM